MDARETYAPRGRWLSTIEADNLDVLVWPAGDGEPVTVAVCKTTEDAKRVAMLLRDLARRLKP